jgi:tetratricopeptide (TPR) repeat protein
MELKSKGMWFGCGIPVVVLGLTVLCIGLYFAGGYGMASMINSGHAEGNCEAAMQFSGPLEAIYPLAIAPFVEQALLNGQECLAYTQALAHENAGEYELAYEAYRDYSKAYPKGQFTELAPEKAAQNLLALGKQHFADGQYEKSVQTFNQLLREYPNGEAALAAEQDLPDVYLAWAREAWQAKDYIKATARMEQMQKRFPKSDAAASVDSLLPQVYLDWGQAFWHEKDYKNAVAKIQHVKENLPQGEFGKKANELLSQIQLDWGQDLYQQKNYGEAIEHLNLAAKLSAGQDSVADTYRQAKTGLCSAHQDWAASLSGQKNFAAAVSHYQTATLHADTEAEKKEIADRVATVYLGWALDLRSKNSFLESIDKVNLAKKSSDANSITSQANKTYQDTIQAFSQSTGTQATKEMNTAAGLVCAGKTVTLPIFALNPDEKRFFSATVLPTDLVAKTPGSMHYVVCVTSTNRKIQTCPYRNTVTRIAYYVERYVVDWQVKVLDVMTGTVLAQNTFTGAYPKLCPYTESNTGWDFQNKKQYYGQKPDIKVLHDWLLRLKLR